MLRGACADGRRQGLLYKLERPPELPAGRAQVYGENVAPAHLLEGSHPIPAELQPVFDAIVAAVAKA